MALMYLRLILGLFRCFGYPVFLCCCLLYTLVFFSGESQTIVAFVGDDAELPCTLQYSRHDLTHFKWSERKGVIFERNENGNEEVMSPYKGRVFVPKESCSLTLHDINKDDEKCYRLETTNGKTWKPHQVVCLSVKEKESRQNPKPTLRQSKLLNSVDQNISYWCMVGITGVVVITLLMKNWW